MKFHDSDPSVNWLGGVKAPVFNADLVEDQFSKVHRYYNNLIQLECERRKVYRDKRAELFPGLLEAEAEYNRLDEEVTKLRKQAKAINAAKRKRQTNPELRRQIKDLDAAKKAANEQAKALRAAAAQSDTLSEFSDQTNEEFNERKKQLRKNSGLHFGTYLTVEKAAAQACSSAKVDPQFRRYTGEGTISVQIQKPRMLDWDGCLAADDTRIRFVPGRWGRDPQSFANPGSYTAPRGGKKSRNRVSGTLWFRIGSDPETRGPVWAKFPCWLWRVPPADADIKWVHIDRIRRANRFVWQVRFVLSRKSGWAKPAASDGVVGVDLGWRLVPEGLRVAYWYSDKPAPALADRINRALGYDPETGKGLRAAFARSDDGSRGQLVLPQSLLDANEHSRGLKSTRDINFDSFKAELLTWMSQMPAGSLPEWFTKRLEHLAKWRSPGKAEALFHFWRGQRFAGDEPGLELLARWRNGIPYGSNTEGRPIPNEHGDLHLWRYETGTRGRIVKTRKHIYRVFAHELAKYFNLARPEEIKLARMVRNPLPEDEAIDEATKRNRNIAAVADLVVCLEQSGLQVEEIPAKDSTRTCMHCGHVNNWSDEERSLLLVTCQGCSATIDQDFSAAWFFFTGGVVPEAELVASG